MLLQRFARQQSLLRAASQCSSCIKQQAPLLPVSQRRLIQSVPALNDDAQLKLNGVRGLYSPEGFHIAWTGYQEHLVKNINRLYAGTTQEHQDVKSLLVQAARDPDRAAEFNYASAAFNNHLFFNGITNAEKPSAIPRELEEALNSEFSSIESLREAFLHTAEAMFGPGFVWLVQATSPTSSGTNYRNNYQAQKKFRILTTYLAGSPLPAAHWRAQPLDMNTQSHVSLEGIVPPGQKEMLQQHTEVQNTAGSMGTHSSAARGLKQRKIAPGGADVTPLLCVSTWEHSYIRDYGYDKRRYLESWWERIDWETVKSLTDLTKKDPFMYGNARIGRSFT